MVKHFALVTGGVKLRVRTKLQLDQSVADAVRGIKKRLGQHLQQTSLLVGIVCEVSLLFPKFIWIGEKLLDAPFLILALLFAQWFSIDRQHSMHLSVARLDNFTELSLAVLLVNFPVLPQALILFLCGQFIAHDFRGKLAGFRGRFDLWVIGVGMRREQDYHAR